MDRLRAANGSEELAAAASAPEFPQLVAGIAATLPQLPPDASLHRVLLGPTCFEEVVDGGVFVLDAVARRHGAETAAALDLIVKRVYQHGHKMQAPRADVFVATAAYMRRSSNASRVQWDTGFTAPANDIALTVMPDASPPKWVTTIETMLSSMKAASARGVAARREQGREATRAAIERATVVLFAADDGDREHQAGQDDEGWRPDWDPSALAFHTEKRSLNVDGDPVDPALQAPLTAWRSPLPPVDVDLAVAEVREARAGLLDAAAELFQKHFGGDTDDDDDDNAIEVSSDSDDDNAAAVRASNARARQQQQQQQQLADEVDLFAPHLSSPSRPAPKVAPPEHDAPLTEAERELRIAKMRALPVAPQLSPIPGGAASKPGTRVAGVATPPSASSGGGDGIDDVAFATNSDAIVFIGGKLQLKPKRQLKPKPAPKPKTAGKRPKAGTTADVDEVEAGSPAGARPQPPNSRPQPPALLGDATTAATSATEASGAAEDTIDSLEAALSQLPAAVRTAAMIGLLSRETV